MFSNNSFDSYILLFIIIIIITGLFLENKMKSHGAKSWAWVMFNNGDDDFTGPKFLER